MKKTTLMTALVSAVALLAFAGPVSADVGRSVTKTYEFPSAGQGDVGGVCFNQPPTVPGTGSCVAEPPADPATNGGIVEDHVEISVEDENGNPVYFTVQQDGNSEFGFGCGSLSSHAGGLFPIVGVGSGGSQAADVVVFPWAGPGVNNFFDTLDPNDLCEGSTHLGAGSATLVFHNHVAP